MADCPLRAVVLGLVECPICKNHLDAPRDLKCGHVVCTTCLQTYLENRIKNGFDQNEICCPECREVTQLENGEVTDLRKNFKIASLASACFEDNEAADHGQPREAACSQHGKVLEIVCTECNENICRACMTAGHDTHDCCLLSDHVKKIDAELQRLLKSLAAQVEPSGPRLQQLETEKNKVDNKLAKHSRSCEQRQKELLELIELRGKAIKKEIDTEKDKQEAAYTSLKQEIETGENAARQNAEDKQARYSTNSNTERFQLYQELQEATATPPPSTIKLPPVSLSLKPYTSWLDLALVPPQHASLLVGHKATVVNGEWARRTRELIGKQDMRGDPIDDKADPDNREDHYLMETSLAYLLKYRPYPDYVDVSAFMFHSLKPGWYWKNQIPITRPVLFEFKTQRQSADKPYSGTNSLIWDLDATLCEAMKHAEHYVPLSARTESGVEVACDLPLKELMSRQQSPLTEFSTLVIVPVVLK